MCACVFVYIFVRVCVFSCIFACACAYNIPNINVTRNGAAAAVIGPGRGPLFLTTPCPHSDDGSCIIITVVSVALAHAVQQYRRVLYTLNFSLSF